VMVTHNLDLVADSDRVIRLHDGRVEVPVNPSPPCDVLVMQEHV
jgi:hypothetical protein